MKCRIGNSNLKVWGKAIQTLISTGDGDVHFQFTDSLVTITAFDSTLTVCCSCSFEKEFFDSYESVTNENGFLGCRVPSKCLLKAFRSQRFLSKSVMACDISLQENSDNLEIAQVTKFGAVVRYSLRLAIEIEALEMDCYPEKLCNWIKVNPKFILGTVSNFGPTNKIADLTMKTMNDKIMLKNCTTDVVKREGKIYTELSVNSVDFAEYAIRMDSEITVPLREFKAFASFADGLKLDLSLHFQGPKDPVIIVIQNELYKATLNLATKVTSENNNSVNVSPATSGLISNVSSQQPDAGVEVQNPPVVRHEKSATKPSRPVLRHVKSAANIKSLVVDKEKCTTDLSRPGLSYEKSARNVAAPIILAESDDDGGEGILEQVNDLEMYQSFSSKDHSLSSERDVAEAERVHGGNNLRKSKSLKTYARKSAAESDVEIIAERVKGLGNSNLRARSSRGNAGRDREGMSEQVNEMSTSKPATNKSQVSFEDSDSLLDHVNQMESEGLELISEEITSSKGDRKSERGQPPKKRVKTFESMFPGLYNRELPPIPGMDVILLPASDEEDC